MKPETTAESLAKLTNERKKRMTTPPINILLNEGVGIIELARPDKFNALSRECFTHIRHALRQFEGDSLTRVVLIRAQGKNFCTGADLEEIGSFDMEGVQATKNARLMHGGLRDLERSRLPVVAAVQGLCLAGGLELMMACDVVLASNSARFGDQHARYGLIPGAGGSQRLPRLVGLRRALDLMFAASWIDAETARQWGLVNYVYSDDALQEAAQAYCRALAKKNGSSIAIMKRLAREGLELSLDLGLEAEIAEVGHVASSAGAREGVAAFLAKREPNFG
ncbi:MAG: enoyl-CoA hydratase/isomerase family protein [Steroidobacteraceae bacterium]